MNGMQSDKKQFLWTAFYEAVAEKLLDYHSDRKPLIEGILEFTSPVPEFKDEYSDGTTGPLQDICPFTAMGTFNRSMTDENRIAIATEIANFLGVEAEVPVSFESIPRLNNQNAWFFDFARKRGGGDIDALWKVFAAAAKFAVSDSPESRAEFAKAYDAALQVRWVKWNLSMGLYWAHPWNFPTLDSRSRSYIKDHFALQVPTSKGGASGSRDYLKLMDDLKARFSEDGCPVLSFPELSLESWQQARQQPWQREGTGTATSSESSEDNPFPTSDRDSHGEVSEGQPTVEPPPRRRPEAYSITDILKDGCFLSENEIKRLLERLRAKKNLILQGPPGTGKTWIAKRLAFALMEEKDEGRIRAVQFHPNLSYEDFVRGWRPTGDGKLVLADGVFMEAIHAASKNPTSKFVVVIEEVNRGNPAQIFGELLTLLEAGKRTSSEALELCYPDADGRRRPVHVPENLYVIGTMNIADRSLALVDLAFRRRFAFVTLEPKFGKVWRDWVIQKCGVNPELAEKIERRINALNQQIEQDLGAQFRIGHSYVIPLQRLEHESTRDWFTQVAETEIGPLLEEYWFDSPKTAKEALDKLIAGW